MNVTATILTSRPALLWRPQVHDGDSSIGGSTSASPPGILYSACMVIIRRSHPGHGLTEAFFLRRSRRSRRFRRDLMLIFLSPLAMIGRRRVVPLCLFEDCRLVWIVDDDHGDRGIALAV